MGNIIRIRNFEEKRNIFISRGIYPPNLTRVQKKANKFVVVGDDIKYNENGLLKNVIVDSEEEQRISIIKRFHDYSHIRSRETND